MGCTDGLVWHYRNRAGTVWRQQSWTDEQIRASIRYSKRQIHTHIERINGLRAILRERKERRQCEDEP